MKKNKKTNKGLEFLPLKLVEEYYNKILSNKDYHYTTKNNFLKCIGIIYNHYLTDFSDLNYYLPLGSSYWKTVFHNNYHQSVIKPLLDINIIQSKKFDNPNHWFKQNLKNSLKDKYVEVANDILLPLIPDYDTITYIPDENLSVNNTSKADDSKGLVEIRYRINPELIDIEEFVEVKYLKNISNIICSESITFNGEDDEYEQDEEYESPILKGVLNVTIEKEKALHWIEYNAEAVCDEFLNLEIIKSLPKNLKIGYNLEDKLGTFNKRFDIVTNIIKKADEYSMKLFFYKDKYYVADLDSFKAKKIKAIKHVYSREVNKIAALPISDNRNTRTLRIYNNLVNFPSKLLQFIRFNNGAIVQIDLKTSQFLLFANLMNEYIKDGGKDLLGSFSKKRNQKYLKKFIKIMDNHKLFLPTTPIDINNSASSKLSNYDVHLFIRDVFYNDFYDVISKELNLNNRMITKQLLFSIFFASRLNLKDEFIKKLADKYPTVMSIIADFKITKDDTVKKSKTINSNICKLKSLNPKSCKSKSKDDINNFPVFLQCIEAEIFIDNILYKLRDNTPCACRHDSIMTPKGKEDEVGEYMKTVFNTFNFRYNKKIDDYFWQVYSMEELDDCCFSDFVSDEDLLNESNYHQKIWEATKPEKLNRITPESELEEGNEFDDEFYNDFKSVFGTISLIDDESLEYCDFSIEEIARNINLKDLFLNEIKEHLDNNEIKLPEQTQTDYFNCVDDDILSELAFLRCLSIDVQNALAEDIYYFNSEEYPIHHFQNKTNELITVLITHL